MSLRDGKKSCTLGIFNFPTGQEKFFLKKACSPQNPKDFSVQPQALIFET
jgi:hypothetical protein